MGYKSNDRCLIKVDEDEPIFVLRAQDKTAPWTVNQWLTMNASTLPDSVHAEAANLVQAMLAWQEAHPERVKMPD